MAKGRGGGGAIIRGRRLIEGRLLWILGLAICDFAFLEHCFYCKQVFKNASHLLIFVIRGPLFFQSET